MICCGKLRIAVCIDCAGSRIERVGEPPQAVREGQLCLRMVENHTNFALMFITAYSNMDAMMIASEHWQLDRMSARPIGD
jgi:hypothetical protein